MESLRDENGNILECFDCHKPATCIVWNDFMGEIPSCESHKVSLTQIASYIIHENGTFTKTLHASRCVPLGKEFPRYELQ